MKHHIITSYQIDEHPNPGAIYDWIRSNWYNLGEFSTEGALDSIKGFCDHFDLSLDDYSISLFPDQGENISVSFHDSDIQELSGVLLWKYLNNNFMTYRDQYSKKIDSLLSRNCPFTGMVFDETLLDEIRDFMKTPDNRDFQGLASDCFHALLSAIHAEGEYLYSDDGLHDLCEANEYDFLESGEIYH